MVDCIEVVATRQFGYLVRVAGRDEPLHVDKVRINDHYVSTSDSFEFECDDWEVRDEDRWNDVLHAIMYVPNDE